MVQRLAHAVQALEFEAVFIIARHRDYGSARMGVVGGKLWIDTVAPVEQHLRAGHVTDIGVDLAGEDREALDPQLLRQLDLGIPVRTLDQSHHDFSVKSLGQIVERFDHRGSAPTVSLHHDSEAFPAGQSRIGQQGFDNIQRQIQPVLFLCIDIETDIGFGCLLRQFQRPWHQLGQHRFAVRVFVTWMQRRQLYRDAGAGAHITFGLL